MFLVCVVQASVENLNSRSFICRAVQNLFGDVNINHQIVDKLMRLCFANQFLGFHTILFLRPTNTKTRKTQSIFRCTSQLCGLICASTTKLQQHVAKKTCQKRQKEAVEQGVTPSEFPSSPPSKLFALFMFRIN